MSPEQIYEIIRFASGVPFIACHIFVIWVIIKHRRQNESLTSPFFAMYCLQSFMDIQYYVTVS